MEDYWTEGRERWMTVKMVVSAIPLGLAALATVLYWFSPEEEVLLHRHWSRLFYLAFLFVMWMSICANIPGLLEKFAVPALVRHVPSLDSTTPRRLLMVSAYTLPAYIMLGWFLTRAVLSIVNPEVYDSPWEIEHINAIPLLGTLGDNQESFASLIGTKSMNASWSAVITLAYDMGVFFLSLLLVSIPTKLVTGKSSGRSRVVRFLVGIAMFTYSAMAPALVAKLLQTSPLSMEKAQALFSRMDERGGFPMLLFYALLALFGGIACGTVFWAFTALLLFCILLLIPSFFFPAYDINMILPPALIIGVLVAFVVQCWEMVPHEE